MPISNFFSKTPFEEDGMRKAKHYHNHNLVVSFIRVLWHVSDVLNKSQSTRQLTTKWPVSYNQCIQWLKWGDLGAQPPAPVWASLKIWYYPCWKVFFMLEMCQILPHPLDASIPELPFDVATLTTAYNINVKVNVDLYSASSWEPHL